MKNIASGLAKASAYELNRIQKQKFVMAFSITHHNTFRLRLGITIFL